MLWNSLYFNENYFCIFSLNFLLVSGWVSICMFVVKKHVQDIIDRLTQNSFPSISSSIPVKYISTTFRGRCNKHSHFTQTYEKHDENSKSCYFFMEIHKSIYNMNILYINISYTKCQRKLCNGKSKNENPSVLLHSMNTFGSSDIFIIHIYNI